MTISNLVVRDDGSITFSGTVILPGESVVFETIVNPEGLAFLVAMARHSKTQSVIRGPLAVKITGVQPRDLE